MLIIQLLWVFFVLNDKNAGKDKVLHILIQGKYVVMREKHIALPFNKWR